VTTDHHRRELAILTAALAHELRTPATAIAGEVELALRRERPAAVYRDILQRVAASAAELIALSGDLAVLSREPSAAPRVPADVELQAACAAVVARYGDVLDVRLDLGACAAARLAGDPALVSRALLLLVTHAVRHRRKGARIALHARWAGAADAADAGLVDVFLEAGPAGFHAGTWSLLPADAVIDEEVNAAALIRLRVVARIAEECGGSVDVSPLDGRDAVRLRLRCAPAGAEAAR